MLNSNIFITTIVSLISEITNCLCVVMNWSSAVSLINMKILYDPLEQFEILLV